MKNGQRLTPYKQIQATIYIIQIHSCQLAIIVGLLVRLSYYNSLQQIHTYHTYIRDTAHGMIMII